MGNISKSFLTLCVLLFVYIFAQTSFAQDFGGGYDLSGGEEDEANLFLQKAIQDDNALKSKAEIFNGKKSGVYEGGKLACPYAFERDLYVGSKGEDVRLLQVLLNSDKRSLIAVSGPGSLGQESDSFGEATKEAVKKFQALFIEYTGVANGRFGPRTRTVMNAICNGESKPSDAPTLEARQNRNIYENIFSVQRGAVPGGIATIVGGNADNVHPRVSLSANVSSIKMGETFKVILNSSEEIVPISPDSLIVDGGVVKEIRKLSKTSYTATIIINEEENIKKVLVQVEADKVEDLAGNKNENASNEISVKVIAAANIAGESVAGEGEVGLNSLLDKIISSAPTCTYNGSGILITVSSDGKPLNTTGCAQSQSQNSAAGQTYNCNGQQIPVTQPCSGNQSNQLQCTVDPVTGQRTCQTSQEAQQAQQAAQARQQAQQNQDIGQMLGKLMGGQGFGKGQNQPGGGQFGGSGSVPAYTPPGGLPGTLPGIAPTATAKQAKELLEFCAKPENAGKSPECTPGNIAQARATIAAGNQESNIPNSVDPEAIRKAEEKEVAACKTGEGPLCAAARSKLKELEDNQELAALKAAGDPNLAARAEIKKLDREITELNTRKRWECESDARAERYGHETADKCTDKYNSALSSLISKRKKAEEGITEAEKDYIYVGQLSKSDICVKYKIGTNYYDNKEDNLLIIIHNGSTRNALLKQKYKFRSETKIKSAKDLDVNRNDKCAIAFLRKEKDRTLTCYDADNTPMTRLTDVPLYTVANRQPITTYFKDACQVGGNARATIGQVAKEEAASARANVEGERNAAQLLNRNK